MKKAAEMSHEELAAALVAMPKRGRGRPKKDTARQSDEVTAADKPVLFGHERQGINAELPYGHLYTAQAITPLDERHMAPDHAENPKVAFTETAVSVLEKHGLVPPAADPSVADCAAWANDVPGIELPMPGELPEGAGNEISAEDAAGRPEPYRYPDFQPVLDPLPAGVRWATVIREPHNRNMKLVKFLDDGSEDIAWVRSRDLDKLGGRMEGSRIKLVVNPDAFQGGWIQWRG